MKLALALLAGIFLFCICQVTVESAAIETEKSDDVKLHSIVKRQLRRSRGDDDYGDDYDYSDSRDCDDDGVGCGRLRGGRRRGGRRRCGGDDGDCSYDDDYYSYEQDDLYDDDRYDDLYDDDDGGNRRLNRGGVRRVNNGGRRRVNGGGVRRVNGGGVRRVNGGGRRRVNGGGRNNGGRRRRN